MVLQGRNGSENTEHAQFLSRNPCLWLEVCRANAYPKPYREVAIVFWAWGLRLGALGLSVVGAVVYKG